MKKYTRKKTGGSSNSGKYSKFDVVKVFSNEQKEGSYERGVLFSKIHRDGTYTVQFENGIQDDVPEAHLVFHDRLDNLNENDIEKKRKDVIRYTLLYEKTLKKYGDPRDTDGNKKGVPDYDGRIRFSIFSGEPFNEDVANMIACNREGQDQGKCSHSTKSIIESPVTDNDILNVYNEEAAQRAAANSLPSSPSSSPPSSLPSSPPSPQRTSISRSRSRSISRSRSRGISRGRSRGRKRNRGRSRGRNRSRGKSRGRNRRNSRS